MNGSLNLTGNDLRDSGLIRLGGTYNAPDMVFGPTATVEMAAASGGPANRTTYNVPFAAYIGTPMLPNMASSIPGSSPLGVTIPTTRPNIDLSSPSNPAADTKVDFISDGAQTAYYAKCTDFAPASSCRGDTLLPGFYGDLKLTGNGRALLLTEGFYDFKTIDIGSAKALVAAQPKGARTVVLSDGDITSSGSHAFIGPDSARLATSYGSGAGQFLGGTMMVVSRRNINVSSDLQIWATLSAVGDIILNNQVTLFGQAFAKRLFGVNNIDFGEGAFISIRTETPVLQAPTFSVGEKADPACVDPSGLPCRDTLITVSLPYTTAYTVTGTYALAESSPRKATAGVDFPVFSDTFSIAKGSLSTKIRVRVFDDSSYEGPEAFRVAFSNLHAALCPDAAGNGDSTIKTCYGKGTIVDDDKAPIVRILADSSVLEGNSGTKALTFKARLFDPIRKTDTLAARNAPELPVGFKWRTADATALVSDNDYVAQASRWDSVPSFGLTKSISVQVRGDLRYEHDDWFLVVADSLRNGAFDGAASDSGIIRNDDAVPSVSIAPISVQEPDAYGDTTWALFRLAISAPSGVPTSVWWSTLDSTAKGTADFASTPLDFLKSNGLSVIAPDSLGSTVRVAVFGDSLFEKSEFFRLSMDSLRDATGAGQGVATILDADSAPRIHIDDASVREPDVGTSALRFRVRLERPSGLPVSLVFDTRDGSAVHPADYTAVSARPVTIPAFVRDTLIDVDVLADSIAGEGTETLRGELSSVVDALPGDLSATGSILDAQDGFRLVVDSVGPVAEADSLVRFVVRTNWIPAHDIRMVYRTVDGTALAGYRYADTAGAVVLPAGSRSTTVAVRLTKDSLWEPQEYFTLRLDSILGANAPVTTDSVGRAWIYEEEELTIWFDTRDTAVREDSAGRVLATLRMSQPASIGLQFDLPLRSGTTATLFSDFDMTTSGLVWPARTRTLNFAVIVTPDKIEEPDELVKVGFEPLTAGRLTGREAWTLTILDDDHIPKVEIQTPPDKIHTNDSTWTVTWTVDGKPQPSTDTTFSGGDGWKTVVRCAEDRFQRQFCDTNTIWLDATPPKVQVFKITGPNPHDRTIDTTWWGDYAKTRYGKDTVWYWVRDSIKLTDGSGWKVLVDTHHVVTDLWGDKLWAIPVSDTDSVGNIGTDTGWIDLKAIIPRADAGYYLDRDRDGRVDALVVELSDEWNADFWPTFDAPMPPESRKGLKLDTTKPYLLVDGVSNRSRLVVPIVEPFRYGATGWDSLQGVLWENWSTGSPLADSFPIRDSVPPVIVKAVVSRTEEYSNPDTVFVTPSEPIRVEGKNWLEVGECPDGRKTCPDSLLVWVAVPADSVRKLPDGRYWFLVPPGDSGSVRPDLRVRFKTGVSDTLGNANDTAKTNWARPVEGAPRPELVVVDVEKGMVQIPLQEINRSAPGEILIRATNGKRDKDGSVDEGWWEPGRGYLPASDPTVNSVCPENGRYCNGPTVYINRPVRMIVYIYDNGGIFVTSRTIDITQADIDAMNPDQLDRLSIDLEWNHRTDQGKVVASGVYIWRIVSYIRVAERNAPVMQNRLIKLGVRNELEDGIF